MRKIALALAASLLVGVNAVALDLVKDGKPACTIVVPDKATPLEREGAETLVKYIKMASGATLPIVSEAARPAGTVVSVGRTKLAERAGISGDGLKVDGYHLRVKGGALYLMGRDGKIIEVRRQRVGAQGSIRAALGLLEQLGFRWLQPTPMGVHVPEAKTIAVPDDLNVTHTPVFWYVAGRMYNWGDWSLANSFRKGCAVFSAGGHTWDLSVPVSLWKDHPDYFRMQGGKRIQPTRSNHQVCPSHPDVVRRITEFTLGKFAEGYDLVALGQQDGFKSCECERCRALAPNDQVHNTQRKVIEACRKAYPDRFVHLLVYGPSLKAPTQFKTYPPNALTEVCLTGSLALGYGSHEAALDFWQRLVPGGATVYAYYMGLYHGVGIGPKFTPRAANEKMRMLIEHGVKGIYFCGGGENWGASGPAYYVIGRLATDPARDWRILVDEYCNLTFRKAGRTMRQYYDLLNARVDSYYVRGLKGSDVIPATFTPEVLDRMGGLLGLARQQAAGDERALGWIDLAEISYRHFGGIARAYHFYEAYTLNPTAGNMAQLAGAVKVYHDFCGELQARWKKDRVFFRNYFPNGGQWVTARSPRGTLRNNMNKLASPFTWDFDKLIETGFLPGKTRSATAFIRLKVAPAIDGDPHDDAWKAAPWTPLRGVSLGKTEASTRMRLGYDDTNLYLAFECVEPKMDEMKVIEYGRDGRTYNTECIEIFLAPDGVGQKRVQIVTSPTPEGRWDGRYGYIDDPLHPLVLSGRPDTGWDPDYRRAYRIDKATGKWTMEIAIPFAELDTTVPPEGTRWRGNFGRERHLRVWDPKKYPNQVELFLWSPNLQGAKFTDAAAFGDVYFGRIPPGSPAK